jgi:phage repressor protein C with HTH and peptisase S24 domain
MAEIDRRKSSLPTGTIEGYLDKKAVVGSKKYWCRLGDDKLSYFSKDDKNASESGCIDVAQVQSVRPGRGVSFEIVTHSKTHLFTAADFVSRDKWVSTVQEAMTIASRKRSTSRLSSTPSMTSHSFDNENEENNDSVFVADSSKSNSPADASVLQKVSSNHEKSPFSKLPKAFLPKPWSNSNSKSKTPVQTEQVILPHSLAKQSSYGYEEVKDVANKTNEEKLGKFSATQYEEVPPSAGNDESILEYEEVNSNCFNAVLLTSNPTPCLYEEVTLNDSASSNKIAEEQVFKTDSELKKIMKFPLEISNPTYKLNGNVGDHFNHYETAEDVQVHALERIKDIDSESKDDPTPPVAPRRKSKLSTGGGLKSPCDLKPEETSNTPVCFWQVESANSRDLQTDFSFPPLPDHMPPPPEEFRSSSPSNESNHSCETPLNLSHVQQNVDDDNPYSTLPPEPTPVENETTSSINDMLDPRPEKTNHSAFHALRAYLAECGNPSERFSSMSIKPPGPPGAAIMALRQFLNESSA